MEENKRGLRDYWFLFWDQTSLTVAAESLEEAEEELIRSSVSLTQLCAVVLE